MGMEFPVALAIVSEFLPTAKRGRYLAIMEGFWPLGFIAAGCLSYVLLSYFDLRAVFLAQAVPALFLFVIRFLVPESPRWLADRGRHDEADRVMATIETKVAARRERRSLAEPQVLPEQAQGERRFSFLELWSPGYASRTVM